eukprot:3066491-Rhodomonas_salina.1
MAGSSVSSKTGVAPPLAQRRARALSVALRRSALLRTAGHTPALSAHASAPAAVKTKRQQGQEWPAALMVPCRKPLKGNLKSPASKTACARGGAPTSS